MSGWRKIWETKATPASLLKEQGPAQAVQSKISLFESAEVVKKFLQGETKYDYSDRNLTSINLRYIDSHPGKGEAWVYSFSHKKPTLGDDLSIFHYTDGTLVEFHHGP